jgi:asparagine synthase (glutamine-hydrolysing)
MLGLGKRRADKAVLERMTASLWHRGPDGEGMYIAGPVGLGFRRLSILDLSHAADQPMATEDGQLVLVFNGEIYNYVELRQELEALGHRFRSTGDTEVLLHAYQEWGRDCLERFNGMWAFVVYDRQRGLLFGSRDRFGVKPLYVYRDKNAVLLASEIKALLHSGLCSAGPNWRVIAEYLLQHRLDESTETFFEGIEHIPPGTAFEIDLKGGMKTWRYWCLPEAAAQEVENPTEKFAELFEDSVRLRMRSDVPVGVCLSGGLDSSAIICAMARLRGSDTGQPLHAFSYHAPEFDESRYIADTISMTQAHLNRLDSDPVRAWSALDKVLSFQDEPVHAMAAVAGFELMALAASNGVKVVLNGQGADEVIGGYSSYFRDYWYTLLNNGNLRGAWTEIGAFTSSHGGSRTQLFSSVFRHFAKVALSRTDSYQRLTRWRKRRGAHSHAWFANDLSRQLDLGNHQTGDWSLDATLKSSVERAPLPLYLRLEDRNSMAHSVEARTPFLDYRLVSLVFKSGIQWKIRGPWNKYLLREAMRQRIPESVRTRIDKWGFPVPQGKWISGAWFQLLQEFLDSRDMRERGIYNLPEIRRDLDLHRQGKIDVTGKLFSVVQLELWSRRLKSLGQPAAEAVHAAH